MDLLLEGGADPAEPKALGGARGAAAQEHYRRHFEQKKGEYSGYVEANMRKHRRITMDTNGPRAESMREFVCDYQPIGQDETLGRVTFAVAVARDQLKAGQTVEALDTLHRLLVAIEQASLEGGETRRWDLAWLVSHLPEPPWHRFQGARKNRASSTEGRFSLLAEPAWVAAAMAYLNDCAKLEESRRKLRGKGRGKGKEPED